MIYYSYNNILYCSQVPVSYEEFTEISREEYYSRLSKAVSNREIGASVTDKIYNED